ncbi:MAG: C40 family peptidase [Clostridia bacterium]|nr:C40 family peptidase [Clostridia bacterium]
MRKPDVRAAPAPRLQFTQEELNTPELQKPIRNAQKAADQRDTAKAKLPQQKKLVRNVTADPVTGKLSSRLTFESTTKPPSKLNHGVSDAASVEVHQLIQDSNEDGNVSVSAADAGIRAVEITNHSISHVRQTNQLRDHRNADRAERQLDKANVRALQAKAAHEQPAHGSNPQSRRHQKHSVKKSYYASRSHSAGKTANTTRKTAGKAADKAGDMLATLFKNKKVWLIGALAAMLMAIMSTVSACAPIVQTVVNANAIGTYPAAEEDVKAAERAYRNMERDLQKEIDQFERRHPEYDEYRYDVDEIWHDPYALIAIISARFNGEEWTIDDAYPVLETYFDLQYDFDTEVRRVTRYRDGEPYTYSICNVTLVNKNLSHQPVYSMSRKQMGLYALYMSTLGNMPDLFAGNAHASELKEPVLYDVPQAYLDADPSFALLITEANKYVGYPYVWGGDSPETSFDCSGFLSYIYTTTGVRNTGRLGATGLYHACEPVDPEDARPGDMVFFEGTMGGDVSGVTHCGLYVGDGWMIHCGNPIGYANLNDSYWRSHFHSFGRAY